MVYTYRCDNRECLVDTVEVSKSINECSKEEKCPSCKQTLVRIYKVGISTNDGFKR